MPYYITNLKEVGAAGYCHPSGERIPYNLAHWEGPFETRDEMEEFLSCYSTQGWFPVKPEVVEFDR